MTSRWSRVDSLSVLILFLLAVGVYWQTTGFEFVNYDDPFVVVENEVIEGASLKHFGELFGATRDHAYLPIYYLSFWIDHAISGKSPFGYHLLNACFHLINALLLLGIWRRLGANATASLVASALFLVHPVVLESVVWVSSRKDLVSMMFLLLGLMAVLKSTSGSTAWAFVFFALACFAKATALVFFPLVCLVMWMKSQKDRASSLRTLAGFGGLAVAITSVHLTVAFSMETAEVSGAGTFGRIISMIGVLSRYGALTLFPTGQTVHHDVPLEGAVGAHEAMGLLALIALIVATFRSRRAPSLPLFGALWWTLSLLPFNNIAPRFSIAMAERYLYISAAGGTLLIATLVARLAKKRPSLGVATLAALIVLSAATAHQRAKVWVDSETLWRNAMAMSPSATIPRLQLGHALEERALNEAPEPAAKTLDEVIGLYSDGVRLGNTATERVQARMKLATVLIRTQRLGDGLACLDAIDADLRESDIEMPRAERDSLLVSRASALIALARNDEARSVLLRVGQLSSALIDAQNMLATLDILEATASLQRATVQEEQQAAVDKFEKGLRVYESILRRSPDHVKTRFDRARALHAAPWRKDALIAVTNEVAALIRDFPNDARSWSLHARVIAAVDPLRASMELARAIRLDPYQSNYYLRLSLMLKDQGKNKDAAQTLLRGLHMLPENSLIEHQLSEFYLSFAHHYRNTKEPVLALAAVERSLGLAGDNPDALVLRGELQESFAVDDSTSAPERRRFWESARRSFERASELNAADTRARSGLARYFKYRGYATLWEATKKVEGTSDADHKARATLLRRRAMADFRQSLDLATEDPEFATIQDQLDRYIEDRLRAGRTHLASLNFSEARKQVKEAIELGPKKPHVWVLKARLEEDDGFPKAARKAWRGVLSLDKDSLQAHYELGKSLYSASQHADAKVELEAFVKLATNDTEQAQLLTVEINVARRIIERCEEHIR